MILNILLLTISYPKCNSGECQPWNINNSNRVIIESKSIIEDDILNINW